MSLDETLDCGEDTGTPISEDYHVPFKFTGKINKLTVKLEPFKPEPKTATESRAELGPMAAPEPDPIEAPEQR
jgi:arylsulfatase